MSAPGMNAKDEIEDEILEIVNLSGKIDDAWKMPMHTGLLHY
jgi:hypothetical protein